MINLSRINLQVEATISVKSVGPLRRIYQRFSPLHIFNVDPHYTDTDATVERNIKTRGEFCAQTRVWNTIPFRNGQKNSFYCCNRMNGAK